MRVRVFPELAGDRPHVGFLCNPDVTARSGQKVSLLDMSLAKITRQESLAFILSFDV